MIPGTVHSKTYNECFNEAVLLVSLRVAHMTDSTPLRTTGGTLKRITLFLIRVGRAAFYNTPIHRIPLVTNIYERLFHFAFSRDELVRVSCHGMQLEIPGKDITILPSLLNQTYEAYELELLEQLLLPGTTFIDVGANIGIYTSIAARLIEPTGIAYSFEPVPENFEILKRNLVNNHLTNVVTEQVAIGDRIGRSVLYLDDNSIGTHSLLRHRPSYRQDQEVDVPITTLDAYFSRAGEADTLDWVGLLASCAAFESYCKVYTAELRADSVAEFLLLNPEFPYSVCYAVERMSAAIAAISQTSFTKASVRIERIAGRLRASLAYAQIAEIMIGGVHRCLNDVIEQCESLHAAVHMVYIDYPIQSALEA